MVDCTNVSKLENLILAGYMMEQLKMKRVVVLDCDDFPSSVRIANGETHYPLQICASPDSKVSIVTSELPIPVTHERQLARGLIAWARKQSIALIVTLYSRVLSADGVGEASASIDVCAAYSTESARQRIYHSKIELVENGSVDGLAAALLSEGSWNNFDVIALQITTGEFSHNSVVERSIQAIDVVLPEVKFDTSSLGMAENLDLGSAKGPASIERGRY